MKNNNHAQSFINFNTSSNQINYVCFAIHVLFHLTDLSTVDRLIVVSMIFKKKNLKTNLE